MIIGMGNRWTSEILVGSNFEEYHWCIFCYFL